MTGKVQTYGWDELNRLVDFNSTWSYTYRSDGLRTQKYKNGSNYSNFRYDGQMLMQDEAKATGTGLHDELWARGQRPRHHGEDDRLDDGDRFSGV